VNGPTTARSYGPTPVAPPQTAQKGFFTFRETGNFAHFPGWASCKMRAGTVIGALSWPARGTRLLCFRTGLAHQKREPRCSPALADRRWRSTIRGQVLLELAFVRVLSL
jgi:hypothetical protein